MTQHGLVAMLGLIGAVILVAALGSGLLQRSRLPQVGLSLTLGAALGPAGLGVLEIDLQSPIFRVVATVSLALVLFSDAVTLNIREARRHWRLALIILGPITVLRPQ